MTDIDQTPTKRYTTRAAVLLAVVCLLVGVSGGWTIRRVQRSAETKTLSAARSALSSSVSNQGKLSQGAAQAQTTLQLKEAADAQAAPLLEQLKAKPTDADLLTRVGNLYYDAQQYPLALNYYGRSLKARPSDVGVRTDMATAYWYMGDAGSAITEFTRALSYDPNNPNTLFNRGLVRWKGKGDGSGALADWQQLLANNPNYEAKSKVSEMIAEVEKAQQAAR